MKSSNITTVRGTSSSMYSATSHWPFSLLTNSQAFLVSSRALKINLKATILNTLLSKWVPSPYSLKWAGLGYIFRFLQAQAYSSPPAFLTRFSYHIHTLPVCTFEADSSQKPALYHLPSERVPLPDDIVLFFVLCVRLN